MMKGGPWNGRDVLEPTDDFRNFQRQSLLASSLAGELEASPYNTNDPSIDPGSLHDLPLQNGGIMEDYYKLLQSSNKQPTCAQVEHVLANTVDLQLHLLSDLPSYFDSQETSSFATTLSSPSTMSASLTQGQTSGSSGWLVVVAGLLALVAVRSYKRKSQRNEYESISDGTFEMSC